MAIAGLFAAPATAELVTAAPPAGFEELAQPQPAVVDVVFDGAAVGLADALVRPGFIRFADPAAVAALLPPEIDRDAVASALTGELRAHAERVCGAVPEPSCGVLAPAVAGVIFDLSRFRADVFVAPEHRGVVEGEAIFLAAPAWTPSMVQAFSAAVSIVPDEATRAVLAGRSIGAAGPARIVGDYGLDAEAGYFTDRLVTVFDRRRWRLEGGLDRAAPVPVLGDRRFVGLRLESSLDMRRDRAALRGSPLVVVLARRSQVEILRDGRLLTAQSLPAGTQNVDTSALPAGAYDVTLRISSPTGIREETRFFVKSEALAPSGSPQFLVEAGVLADDAQAAWPRLGDAPFLHGALRYRLADGLGAGADLAATADELAGALHAAWLWRTLEGRLDAFAATDGAFGAALAGRGALGPAVFSARVRRSFAPRRPGRIDPGDREDPDDDLFVPDDALESLTALAGDTTQIDLAVAYPFAAGPRLGFKAFWREARGSGTGYGVGPDLYWPLGRVGGARLDLFADAAATDDEAFVLARLRLAFAAGPWRLEGEAGYRASDRGSLDDGPAGAVTLARSWSDGARSRARAALRAERDARVTTVGAGLEAAGDLGYVDASVDREIEAGTTRFALTGRTGAFATRGGLGIGGADAADSAIIVDIDGAAAAAFEILVDERPTARVRAGERAVLALRPYEAYRIRLRQASGPLVAYDGTVRERTLLPGSVAAERWQVRPLVSVFARVVGPEGRPLVDATLETEPPYYTDRGGYLQADLPAGRPAIDVVAAGRRCRLALPTLVPSDAYQRLGDVPCRFADGSS